MQALMWLRHSPLASSLRIISAITAANGYTQRQWSATLDGIQLTTDDVDAEHYLQPGDDGTAGTVYHLLKPLRGSPASCRSWQRTMLSYLVQQGCKVLPSDDHVLRLADTIDGVAHDVIISVHTDRICAASSHDGPASLLSVLSDAMDTHPNLSCPSTTTDLTGIEIDSSVPGQIKLHQTLFIRSLFEKHMPIDVNTPSNTSIKTPATPADHSNGTGLAAHAMSALGDSTEGKLSVLDTLVYQDLVSSLILCATGTRPDIAYATGMLQRCLLCPTTLLLDDAYRVLRYLHRHDTVGITYSRSRSPLAGMSDSDWAIRRSTTGWSFILGKAVISWDSSEQSTIALSSCEAEIIAASSAADEAIILDDTLRQYGISSSSPISLSVDNKAARDLTYNPEHHDKTKHIDRHHFRIRQLVESHRLTVPYVSTADNYSDFFTKALPNKLFYKLRSIVMNIPTP